MERSQNIGSIPPRAAELIAQMNRHPRFLSLLGILPNQLRTLLKETNHENREEAILDLSRTLFFAGFRIWNKRQKLASRFWKNIAPENRSITHSYTKGKKRKKITSLLLNVEIHFIFFGDIEISQIYVRTSAPAPKPQRKQRKCQISKLLGSFIYHWYKSNRHQNQCLLNREPTRLEHSMTEERNAKVTNYWTQNNEIRKPARHNKFR